jgi:hypothetical protein
MVTLDSSIAQGNSYAPAVFGLAGSLIGGFIVGAVSLLVARQAREAAEGAWIRDNRREIYDRLLTCAERLLHACEAYKDAHRDKQVVKASVESAFTDLREVYGVVQTVASTRLVEAVRVYTYRLWELAASLGSTSVMGPENFSTVIKLIRDARHDMIDAMRAELGLSGPPHFPGLRRGQADLVDVQPAGDPVLQLGKRGDSPASGDRLDVPGRSCYCREP